MENLEFNPFEDESSEIIIFPQDIAAKLEQGYEWIDAAIKILGLDPADENVAPKAESARSRMYRYVTGDFASEGKSFKAKSLSHDNAFYCLSRFVKGTEYKTHIELAKAIIMQNWKEMLPLMEEGFKPERLPVNDNVGISGASIEQITEKAYLVTGIGWIPKSQAKFSKGKLWVPAWIVENKKNNTAQ